MDDKSIPSFMSAINSQQLPLINAKLILNNENNDYFMLMLFLLLLLHDFVYWLKLAHQNFISKYITSKYRIHMNAVSVFIAMHV